MARPTMSAADVRRGARFSASRVLSILGVGVALAFSCTPPDRQIVVDGSLGGGAGEGGEATDGNESGGGSPGGGSGGAGTGGSEPTGGTDSGGSGGGSGGQPVACDDSSECSDASAPICDDDSGECRGCDSSAECESDHPATPLCDAEGACVECLGASDCTDPALSICDGGACRGCEEHSECESLVCRPDGVCEEQSAVVYALAETGSYDDTCGTLDLPCIRLSDAIALLSASRPTLVLVPTIATFDEGATLTLPDGFDVTVLGNSVEVIMSDITGFVMGGSTVRLEDVFLTGSGGEDSDPDQTLVSMTTGRLFVDGCRFQETFEAIDTTDSEVHVVRSEFARLHEAGVNVWCTSNCGAPSRIEFTRFEHITRQAFSVWAADSYIGNNLFVEVGTGSYARGLDIRGDGTVVEFNTVIRSGSCAYTGLFACNSTGLTLLGNVSYASTTLSEGGDGTPCNGQIYYSCPNPSYSISEVTLAGTGNFAGDPLFVDYAGGDFRLSADSPGVDIAPLSDEPALDFDANPRPVGDGLDAGAFERQ